MRGLVLLLGGIVACLLAAPSALAAETVATALFGTVRANGRDVAVAERLSSDEPDQITVETGLASGCVLLHGEALLVEMSPSTKLTIKSATGKSGPVVEIADGSARITTRLDDADAATEIHTPSAIVRPRSSTLYLEVNGYAGTTMVASFEDRAFVLSNDRRHKRAVFLDSAQWVSVSKGEPPGTIEKLEASVAASLVDPEAQRRYRASGLEHDVHRESEARLADIARADVPEGEPVSLANRLPVPKEFSFEYETIDRTLVCDPTTCGLFSVPEYDPGPGDPPGCIGIPGEQCQP